ncbi:hypothetical protein TrVGV298_012122 [Trichoderma virens]|nr:hypothetical protein TrVGV298_012122 [Trichoderma virens]
MDAAVVSLRSPDISALAPSRTKRKWEGDGDVASGRTTSAARSRARTNGYETRRSVQRACSARTEVAYALSSSASAATETKPVLVAANPRRVPVPEESVTIPQTQPPTYPDPQLHSTDSPSGHYSVAQDCCAGTIFCHDNDATLIAYTEAPAYYTHYSTMQPESATPSPHFQQSHWPVQGQPGDGHSQSHIPQVPLRPRPQSVPLPLIQANGSVYPAHPVSPHHDTGANLAGFPPGHAFQPPAFGLTVQYNIQQQFYPPSHHFQQFSPHQGTEQRPTPTPQVYIYNNASIPPHVSADTRQVSHSSIGVSRGRHIPETHQQARVTHYLAQQPTMNEPIYTGSEAAASGVVHAQDDGSYEQHTLMGGSADWQRPVGYVTAEAPGTVVEIDDAMSDASGISDTIEIHCDVHDDSEAQDDSAGTGDERQEPEPSSSVKEEDAAVSSGRRSKRSQLSHSRRKKTAATRRHKACTRCRIQKMRCATDPTDPTGACVGCKSFSKTSKKTIHRMPCYRGKITDAILFRKGGLELTKRWKDAEMKDVGDRVNPKEVRTISITLGICKEAIEVKVVAFKPQEGDVTARFWMDGEQGVKKKKELATYCLSSIYDTAADFEGYIKRNALQVMWNERAGGNDGPKGILEETYAHVLGRFQDLRRKPELVGKEERELNVLGNLVILWFAMRHSTGSSWIQGKETLGMKPETRDDTYPLFKRVSVPRMILAQFDSINYTRILSKYGKFVLGELESLMSRNQPEFFFLVYACLFILLREASWTSADRYRHARNNYGQSVRYSIPQFVESLHNSCNNLLQHWHYYNAKQWPKPSAAADRFNTQLAQVEAVDYNIMMKALTDPAVQGQLDVWRRYKADNGYVNQPAPNNVGGRPYEGRQVFYDWDHPLYWVAQLFEENWQPHATYQAEQIDLMNLPTMP